ncbi:phytase [Shewanella scandinavica]|uniref:Phytase n=1 Tax=Shewanella scandinavica TaxID=3063538 RepID=A0ABU3FYS5_9GAMM|nr:phytase [Shewanella sp. SP2S1-2]MDT3280522.1 phytase [Shewanella sp. SP2S1-2]
MKKTLLSSAVLLGLIASHTPLTAMANTISVAVQTIAGHKGSQAQPLIFNQDKQSDNTLSHWLFTSEQQGLMLQTVLVTEMQQGMQTTVAEAPLPASSLLVKGDFELLAFSDPYALTLDRKADRVRPIMLKEINGKPTTNVLPLLPMGNFEINWICIQPRTQDGNIYAWFGGESGKSEQWLLGNAEHFSPKLMRSQSIPVNSTDCAINGDTLYVSEPEAGVWQFDASPFADTSAKLIFPAIYNQITGLNLLNGQLLLSDKNGKVMDDKGTEILSFSAPSSKTTDKTEAKAVTKAQRLSLAINASTSAQAKSATFAIYDDKNDRYLFTEQALPQFFPQKLLATSLPSAQNVGDEQATLEMIVEIPAWVESAPSDRPGDTMDDPAIWVHPTEPEKSLVLGTNKRWGLLSFNMRGEQVQALPSGRINNVDLRQQVLLGGKKRDIAVATQREHDSLAFYEIDAAGKITEYPNQATNMTDIYGMCLYQDEQTLYVFANEKSGRIAQYRVDWQQNGPSITLVRDIHTPSQVEGCVVDEAQHALFIGEEDKGIWRFNAKADASTEGKLIIKAEGDLVADVEGISLYQGATIKGKKQDLLVVSSQGNNSYLLYQASAPYTQVGRFRIGVNLNGMENGHETSIDGSAETDGLAVTHLPVGHGVWQQGMLVVQDGHNHLPDANQAFKWLPWSSIVKQLDMQ